MRIERLHLTGCIAGICVVLVLQFLQTPPPLPTKDAVRYADYVYNLTKYQTFGLGHGAIGKPPQPGYANGPLYPWMLSAVVSHRGQVCLGEFLESTPRHDCAEIEALHHHQQSQNPSCGPESAVKVSCQDSWFSLYLLNYLLVGVSLVLCGVLAVQILPYPALLFVAPASALLAMELTDYAQHFVMVNLVVPLFLALQVSLLYWIRSPGWVSTLTAGLLLGCLTLTRPEYLFLVPVVLVVMAFSGISLHRTRRASYCLGLLFIFLLTLSPWLWRNLQVNGSPSLNDSRYAHHILGERLAYNRMTWPQWLVAFVYWFPDVGDKVAVKLFDSRLTGPFSRHNPGSFSERIKLPAENGNRMFVSQVLADPVKHGMVSLALAYRGLFIGKWWTLIALPGYLLLLHRLVKMRRFELVWISLLPVYMLLLRAGITVNVARYNIPLIGIFALGLSHLCLLTLPGYRQKLGEMR